MVCACVCVVCGCYKWGAKMVPTVFFKSICKYVLLTWPASWQLRRWLLVSCARALFLLVTSHILHDVPALCALWGDNMRIISVKRKIVGHSWTLSVCLF